MENRISKTVMFITGAFVSHTCWDQWRSYFESRGYTTIAPAWPHKDAPAATLRSKHPNIAIASIRLNQLINHYEKQIQNLEEKPILIGHSLGGLITQILLQGHLAAAGVAIHSVPPQGIIPTQLSFYRSTWKALGYFTSKRKSYLMSFKDWQYAFTNGMSLEEQQKAYDLFAVPESKLVLRDALTRIAKIDFKGLHAPLLFVAGSSDHCIPAALNRTNFEKYRDKQSITDFKELAGRNHFVLGQPTWKEDANYILDWISALPGRIEVTRSSDTVLHKQI